jgi:hypothetical protein
MSVAPETWVDKSECSDWADAEAPEQMETSMGLSDVVGRMQREWDETPHRCAAGCGEKVLRQGATCVACERKQEDIAERRDLRSQTLQGLPARYKGARFGAPELALGLPCRYTWRSLSLLPRSRQLSRQQT